MKTKKILSILLTVLMVMGVMPIGIFTASAAGSYTITNATTSDNADDNNGYITVNSESAAENDSVIITEYPNEGYALDVLTVSDGTNTISTDYNAAEGTYTFTMPAKDVTVSATFAKLIKSTTTIADGNTSTTNSPFYVGYFDAYTKTNIIYTENDLADAGITAGTKIEYVKFYIETPAESGHNCNNVNVEVYLKKVTANTVGAAESTEGATKIYEGAIDFSQNEVTLTLSEPYIYTGGNLMLITQNTTDLDWYSVYFCGKNTSLNQSGHAYSYTSLNDITSLYNTNFLPKTTFGYEGKAHNITNNTTEANAKTNNGYITIDKTSAADKNTVTVTAFPNEYYSLDTITVSDGTTTYETSVGNEVDTYTFKMPSKDVTVSATFKPGIKKTKVIADGTATNKYAPFYVCYYDAYTKTNIIYTENDLTEAGISAGTKINSMTFYLSDTVSSGCNDVNVQIYLKEVTADTVDTAESTEGATKVYEGTIDFSKDTVIINFSEPYVYNGGNLMLITQNTTDTGYGNVFFYGAEKNSNQSGFAYSYISLENITSLTGNKFLPKTAISYEIDCYNVINNTKEADKAANNGYITVDKEIATGNETITITVKPNEDCVLDTLTVSDGTNIIPTTAGATEGTYTFTIPAKDVTVSATFKNTKENNSASSWLVKIIKFIRNIVNTVKNLVASITATDELYN